MTLFGFVFIREKTYEALHRRCADLEVRLVQFERRSAAGRKGRATRAEKANAPDLVPAQSINGEAQ